MSSASVGKMEFSGGPSKFVFGTFELNTRTGELRRSGIRVRLQEQPFRVLAMLLARPAELVTRDELKQALWSDAEFGDFDQGLNVAVKKIRVALGDSADNPRFIETLAKRGYRFIAPVTVNEGPRVSDTTADVPTPVPSKGLRWKVAAAMAALVVIAVAAGFVVQRPREYSLGIFGVAPRFRLTPLTSSLGYEADPQFSPDGKEIAYVWAPGKAKEPPSIYVKVLGAGNPVRLLKPEENVGHVLPTWSPDGRYIACVRVLQQPDVEASSQNNSVAQQIMDRDKTRPDHGVYLLPSVGGEERKLFNIRFINDLKWSPDGKWLLVSTRQERNDPSSLWRYSLDGAQRQQLTFPPPNYAGDSVPAYSPDGKLIAFSRNFSSGGSDIFIVPSGGGEPRRVTFDAQHVHGISFTADGEAIIFSSAREGGQRRALWRVSLKGGTPTRLPFGSDNVDSPVMSQTGDHLAYVQVNQSTRIWAYDLTEPGQTPKDPIAVISSRQLQVGPQYSPDGKRLAFASTRTGSWEIWVAASDGGNPVQLTNFGDRQTGTPRWSPDGKYIVFDARPEKRSDIYVIDSMGGTPRKLTSGPHDNVVPSFSRDGKWIYFSSNAGGNWDLWKMAVDGKSAPVQMTHDQGFSAFESIDEGTLYYSKWDKPGIFSMPVAGGPETLVTIELLPRLWGCWAVAEKGLYLIRPAHKPDSKDLMPVISFYDFQTKQIKDLRPLNDAPNPGPSLAVSPDGKMLLYTQPDEGGSDIMIVDNFR